MITLPLLLIAALYLALVVWIVRKFDTWLARIVVVLVLLSPVIYWVGGYQYVHYRHELDCAREGGLKVIIQPEKVDRVQLDADSFGAAGYAEFLLRAYAPELAVVEAWDGEYTGKGKKTGYFAYTIDPATASLPKKNWRFIKTPLAAPTDGLYVISKTSEWTDEISKTQTALSRNGKVYASWSEFYHYWSRNGVMNIGWQCFQNEGAMLQLASLIVK